MYWTSSFFGNENIVTTRLRLDTVRHRESSRWVLEAQNNEFYIDIHSDECRLVVARLILTTFDGSFWNRSMNSLECTREKNVLQYLRVTLTSATIKYYNSK